MSTALASIRQKIQEELQNQKESVPPPSGMTISTKGKIFTLPNGQSSPGPMQAIILDYRNTRTFYKGAYNPNQPEIPSCFAIAKLYKDLVPSTHCKEPQAKECATCTFDQWGSATNGSKAKACKNGVRLAIVPTTFTAESQPMILNVSPTGLKSWGAFVAHLDTLGLTPTEVVCQISFDKNQTFPTLVFKAEAAHDRLEEAWPVRDKAQAALDKEPNTN